MRSTGIPPSRSRSLASLYIAGPFSMGYVDFYTFLIPLYGLSLGFDASEVGILVGARSVVAMFLAIHIGVLMDRFGTRKVTLFFVWTGMTLAPLFPLLPWFWPLLLLQLINGAAVSFAWSGAQTLIAQLAEGDATISGPVHLLRAARLDHGTDPSRRRLGFWRRLAGLSRRHRVGRRADHRAAARAGGRMFRAAATRWNGPGEIPRPRRLAASIGLPRLRSC